MTEPHARVITDSISSAHHRVTTLEVVMHRFVLAEFNTHRMFSRNSASSRAIPFKKQVERALSDMAVPVVWPAEKPGMQGGEPIPTEDEQYAYSAWEQARDASVSRAQRLADVGVHKSVANRLLEPFTWHTVVVTATDWDGFWQQRCSPLAQPEIRVAAEAMKAAYDASTPRLVAEWDWHLPYIHDEDREWAAYKHPDRVLGKSSLPTLAKISAARCARVSYLTQDGRRDQTEDLKLYDRLVSASPMHASPLEHVCTPHDENVQVVCTNYRHDHLSEHSAEIDQTPCRWITRPKYGNLLGWHQLRYDNVEA